MDICPFDDRESVVENSTCKIIFNAYPVNWGHRLVIPKRHVAGLADLTHEERHDLIDLVIVGLRGDNSIFLNDGPLAGRTIHHLHLHVIPRIEGDVPEVRGGLLRAFPVHVRDWLNKK